MNFILSTFVALLLTCLLIESGASTTRGRMDQVGVEEDLISFLTSKGNGENQNPGRNLETASCPDSNATTKFVVQGLSVVGPKTVGCVTVYARNEYYCPRGGRTHCPDSCDTCAEFSCKDSRALFVLSDGTERTCNFNKFSQANVVRMCKDPQFKNACRHTCADSDCVN
mmetsp:Transcript_3889/g.3673  ORF Transcript_3889/g.3673 Transcript_3889/m.3673 type:complete len:169 (-) Transcript_3889:138-644(-)